MSKKIASLYAEIGADTTKLETGLKKSKTNLTEFRGDLKNVAEGAAKLFTGMGAAAVGMGAVFNEAMDMGKAGAELTFAESRFDKLSTSIGAVSDALKFDLRNATKGMVADSQLVNSAGSFMALGLAKTSDEVVRLTRVAGALGMDMNQLVLTLTNQTTARFDALGVSVDGFEDKVNSLKASGMDANKAFNEAFLQQAEEQIERVGDAADGATAAFVRLEVATKNLSDAALQKLSLPLTNAALGATLLLTASDQINKSFDETSDTLLRTSDSYKDYFEANVAVGKVAGYVHDNTWANIEAYENNAEALEYVTKKLGILSEAEYETTRATIDATTAAEHMKFMFIDQAGEISRATGKVFQLTEAQNKLQAVGESLATANQNLSLAYIDLGNAQKGWMENTGGDVVNVLESAGLKGEKFSAALGAIDDVYGTGFGIQQAYKDDLKALTDEYKNTGNIENFKTKLGELKDTYMPLNEQIKDATDNVKLLRSAIDRLESKKIRIEVEISGGGKYLPGIKDTVEAEFTPRAMGGPVMAGVPYIVGEDGPEVVVPNQSGVVIPNSKTIGSTVNNFNFYGVSDPDQAAKRIVTLLGQSARKATASGMGYKGG